MQHIVLFGVLIFFFFNEKSVGADVSHLVVCYFGGPVVFHYVANAPSGSCEFSLQGDISWLYANKAHG